MRKPIMRPIFHGIMHVTLRPQPQAFHAASIDQVVTDLGTNRSIGLTQAQVQMRQIELGPNEIQESVAATWYQILLRQFKDVLVAILTVAALISIVVGEWTDAATIFAIICLNGLLGFVQEWRAERALAALRGMLSPRCAVIRESRELEIEARDLVHGDIVLLETGDRVPADLRLIQCSNTKADESVLTGESLAVSKSTELVDHETLLAERSNMAWTGTTITNGRAMGVVVATAGNTEFGRIAQLTESIDSEVTPLQRKLAALGRQLGFAAVIIAIMIGVAGSLMGKPLMEMFLTGVSLAVAVVPEGLPAVVTLTMAIGIRAMVRRKALLRRLRSAETLGAATIVCTDKTGTLTKNEMTVRKIWLPTGTVDVTGIGFDPAGHFEIDGQKIDYRERSDLLRLLKTGLHCNHARLEKDEDGWHEFGDPTEAALVVAAYKAWLDPNTPRNVVGEYSFDSNRKRMTVIEVDGERRVAHIKGAPEVILPRCNYIFDGDERRELTQIEENDFNQVCNQLASQGLRVLALARHEIPSTRSLTEECVETDLTLLGVVGMMDPPRNEVADAIETASDAGVAVMMITGDSASTAGAVAKQIGLPVSNSVTGSDIDGMTDNELAAVVQDGVAFSRTTPEHKLRIVDILQRHGHVVGMTGDGVNDAPALKKADIGIAMGKRGTDVAKGASDIVLTDDNFASIVGAIEEGRRQYDNIQKFIRYLLSSNTGEVIAIFINILIGGPLILLPVQILWMNLVTDGLTAVALGMEPSEKTLMKRPPRDPKEPVLNKSGVAMILAFGTYIGLATLWIFHHYLDRDPSNLALAQTVAFTAIIVIEKANVLNFRSFTSPMTRVGFFTNPWILIAITGTMLLQAAAVYVPFMQTALHTVPLGGSDWLAILAIALPIFVATEVIKALIGTRDASKTVALRSSDASETKTAMGE